MSLCQVEEESMIDSDHTSSSLFSDDENDSTLLHQLAISRLNQQHKLQKQKPKHFDIDFCCPGHVIDLCRESELITMLQQIAKPTLSSSIYSLIIHFYADSFKRCSIMDQHLVILAQKWRGKACRVVRIRATEAPFLVTKWAVKALPHIAIVLGDKLMDSIVGFEGLGEENDNWPTLALEQRVLKILSKE